MRYVTPNLEEVGTAQEIVLGSEPRGTDWEVGTFSDKPPMMALGLDD